MTDTLTSRDIGNIGIERHSTGFLQPSLSWQVVGPNNDARNVRERERPTNLARAIEALQTRNTEALPATFLRHRASAKDSTLSPCTVVWSALIAGRSRSRDPRGLFKLA